MATVTTTSTGTAQITTYESPAARAGAVLDAPIGEIVFTDSFDIPAKLAADENYVVVTCTLPRNFFYRLRYMSNWLIGSSTSDLDDFQGAMYWTMTENQIAKYYFPAIGPRFAYHPNTNFKWSEDATTNDFGQFYVPDDWIRKVLVDASEGISIVRGQLLDSSANANAASRLTYRLEFDTYTIDQAKSFQVNRAILTL